MKTIVTKTDTDFAAQVIKNGGLAAVPTETVYGLSANGFDADAVEKIYEVKLRPEAKPINLLVRNMADAEKVCRDIPSGAYRLAGEFWPGPLTMIFKRRENVPYIVTAGGETLGVRAPKCDITLELIEKCGVPLATPSANISGEKSAVTCGEVLRYFDGKIECVIDGGRCELETASTIVDFTGDKPRILRRGVITKSDLERVLNEEVLE